MKFASPLRAVSGLLLLAAIALVPSTTLAAKRARAPKPGEFNPRHETVELFAAMKDKTLDVRVIMADERHGKLVVKNNTKRPLNVQLPEAFATAPVLAQFGGGGGFGNGGGRGGGGGQAGGGGAQQGIFNIPPEKIRKIDIHTVCLQHGKKNPHKGLSYTIRPLEEVTDDAQVQQLVRMYAKRGPAEYKAFQAAAWHLTDELSWKQLAAKQRKRLGRESVPYFQRREIVAAKQVAEEVIKQTKATTSDRVSLSGK